MDKAEFVEKLRVFLKPGVPGQHNFPRTLGNLFRPRKQFMYRNMPSYLKNGMKLCDLTSSIGYYGAYFKAVDGFTFDYYCLDNAPVAADIAKSLFKNLNIVPPFFEVRDVKDPLPYKDNFFDIVIFIEWFGNDWSTKDADPYKIFKEILRVLKPKGILFTNVAIKLSVAYYSPSVDKRFLEYLKTHFEVLHEGKDPLIISYILRKK